MKLKSAYVYTIIIFAIALLIVLGIVLSHSSKPKVNPICIVESILPIPTPSPSPSLSPTPSPSPTPTPSPSPTPTPSPSPTPTPSPTPIPQPIETEYHPATEGCLTPSGGVFNGPSGRETYYNLDMTNVIRYMRELGYSEEEYPYWIREDGCKMFGDYIMVAANWDIRPKGTILETSLGTAIVVDTGSFIYTYPEGVDVAVAW